MGVGPGYTQVRGRPGQFAVSCAGSLSGFGERSWVLPADSDCSSAVRRSSLGGRCRFCSSMAPQLTSLELLFAGRGGKAACDEWWGCSAGTLSPAAAAGEGTSMCLTREGCPQCPPPPLVLLAPLLWLLKWGQSLQLKYPGVFFSFPLAEFTFGSLNKAPGLQQAG